MNIGLAIITIRKSKNLSQEQLAYEAGISRHYMYKLENNKASPTVSMLEKIAAVLEIKPSELLSSAENY